MSTYKLPCGCVVQQESAGVQRVLHQCDCCAAELSIDLDAIETAQIEQPGEPQ